MQTKGGKAIYIVTHPGQLYRLHPESDSLERIGSFIPETERRETDDGEYLFQEPHLLGMALSEDEKSIYSIPLRKRILKSDQRPWKEGGTEPRGPQVPLGLYRFDLVSRTSSRVADVPREIGFGYITGTNIRDHHRNFYFAHHGGGYLGLVKVNPGK